jgi:6-pyruvoyltetrahydropterin/6-carboxytetrahydropterin synthase
MYELTVRTHFDAAHSLVDYPGACARLHGHTFKIDVVIKGEKLDEIDILYDFKDLKESVNQVLDRFDHRHMNEIPPFDKLSPTAENFARYLYGKLNAGVLPDGLSVAKVTVWESDTAGVAYFE